MLRSVVIRDVALVTKDPLLKLPAMMVNSAIHDLEWCTEVLRLRLPGESFLEVRRWHSAMQVQRVQ
jgi:hypothetical protein